MARKNGKFPKPAVNRIKPDPANLRDHPERNKQMIHDSLVEAGAGRSILLSKDGTIVAGNGVYEQALALGMKVKIVETDRDTLIAVQRPDLEGEAAERMALFDNRAGELATWNYQRLAQREKEALARIFNDTEIEAIRRRAAAEKQELQREAVEAVEEHDVDLQAAQAKWQTKVGDRFYIKSLSVPDQMHTLLCGDSTKQKEVSLGLGKVQAILTSPPYADRRSDFYESIPEDKYLDWWGKAQKHWKQALLDAGSFFLNIKPHARDGERSLYVFDLVTRMVREWGWKFIDELCWLKNPFPADFHTRFKNGFEPVYHFALDTSPKIRRQNVAQFSDTAFTGDGRRMSWGSGKSYVRGVVNETGLVYPSNVIKAGGHSGGHAASYPVALAEFFVLGYSDPGDAWGDPFCGSGTTLIACEKNARLGRGIELKPEYVSWTLDRLEAMGLEIKRVDNGK